MAAVLWATVWFSSERLARNASYPGGVTRYAGDWLIDGWVRWDGGWYVDIAQHGYTYVPDRMSSVAFFPGYPLAMRLVALVVRDETVAGVLVSALCGLGAVVLVHRWCRARFADDASAAAVALLIVFPYAWYLYGAIYADAFFLVATVGAFVLLERNHPVLAGLAGAVAVASRPVGIGVFLGLLAVGLARRQVLELAFFDRVRADGWRTAWRDRRPSAGERKRRPSAGERKRRPSAGERKGRFALGVHPGRLRPGDAGLLLPLGGLVAWSGYLSSAFGDPFLFANVQAAPGWDQRPGPHTWFKVTWLGYLRDLPRDLLHPHEHWDHLIYGLGITVQALLVIGCLCLVPMVVRRVGWPYAVYVVGVVGVPLVGSKDWQGTGRYLLAAFPVFAVLGVHLVERWSPMARRAVFTSSALLLVFLVSGFARGFYLA
jgi:hypothetical protein